MEMEENLVVGIRTESLVITPEILALIARIDEFKGAWAAIGRIAPERLNALKRVASLESIGSSTRIEGAKLSDKDVERLLSNLNVTNLASRDAQEVAGYAEALDTIFAHWLEMPLTENHLKQLHRDLLTHSSKDQRHRGEYKKMDNQVEAFAADGRRLGVVFETTSPFDTPRLMTELVNWTRESLEAKMLHRLIVIAVFVVVFLQIHPFQDGNGRLSRIVTTLLLLRAGYSYVPYSSLEAIVEQSKEHYYAALRRTQRTIRTESPDWQPWLTFFLRSLQAQVKQLEGKIERERLIFASLPELSVQIMELCGGHGRITVAEVVKATGANRNTVKDHLRKLTRADHLSRYGAGRGAWYGVGQD